MSFSSLFEIWLRFKYITITGITIVSIVVVKAIVLNLLLLMLYSLALFKNVLFKSKTRDSLEINAVIDNKDKIYLKNIGFFVREEKIGNGFYGTVYKAYHKVSRNHRQRVEAMAIKVIEVTKFQQIVEKVNSVNKEKMRSTLEKAIIDLEKINDKNIVKIERLNKTYNENNEISKLLLFSEMAEMNLNDFFANQRPYGVGEECARLWFRQICEAVHCLHVVNKVSHRNIKPENILLFTNCEANKSNNKIAFNAKLADSGIAALFPNSTKVCTKKNPIFVISPLESIANNSSAYDIYTLGVILILLLKGNIEYIVPNYKPFALFANFSDRYVDEIEDKQLFNLLEAMLNPSPHSRIDINAVLSHPWLKISSKNDFN